MNKQRGFKPVFLILTFLLGMSIVSAQPASADFITITLANANQLELGYVIPGFCYLTNQNLAALSQDGVYDLSMGQKRFDITSDSGQFSPKGNYFITYPDGVIDVHTGKQVLAGTGFFDTSEKYFAAAADAVYEVATRKRVFRISSVGWFSPDSKLVAVQSDAVYVIKTGRRLYDLQQGIVGFSPNSKYFTVWGYGLYDAVTGKQLIASTGGAPEFSLDSRYISISEDGVYNIESRKKVVKFQSTDTPSSFSPDSKSIAVITDGVYDLATGNRLFKISGNKYATPLYFGNTNWLDVDDDGVYDLSTGKKQLDVSGHIYSASPDGSLTVIDQKGIFETTTGQLKFRIRNGYFAIHDKLVLSYISTSSELSGLYCAIYGIKGDKWPYRSGLVDTSHTQIYNAPNGDKRLDAQGRPLTTARQQAVFAQTTDKQWFKIGDNSWVKASDVQPVSLPEGIPIENPS
ncbi:MAG: hypothetical protein H0X30_08445 [Anaerolineae bacterium]|nr:hypothetical protein [Anaerolineae bacterium]